MSLHEPGVRVKVFDRSHVGMALREARAKCADELRWLNAINRAAINLEACRWQFDGWTLKIESAHDSGTYYTVSHGACECQAFKAGRACWHRAAHKLLCNAAGLATRGGLHEPTLADLQREADELAN